MGRYGGGDPHELGEGCGQMYTIAGWLLALCGCGCGVCVNIFSMGFFFIGMRKRSS